MRLLLGLCLALACATPAHAFEFGLVSGSDGVNEAERTRGLAPRVVRLEFPIGASVSAVRPSVEAYRRAGARLVLLAGFEGRIPSVAEARNVGTWGRAFGRDLAAIEFGNETSYAHQYGDDYSKPSYVRRARVYAERAREAARSLAGTGVGLLVQGEDGGSGSSNWVDAMFDAVPDLARHVHGWTVHPYGPRPRWQGRMDRMQADLRRHGAAHRPMWITEYGIASDNGRCLDDNYDFPRCLTWAQAGRHLRTAVRGMRARYGSRLAAMFLYRGHDGARRHRSRSREDYFGALTVEMTAKGAYTAAVRDLLSR